MRFTSSQTSFKSGRLSPKLFNRVDTTQYRDGASELSGCRPILEGGVEKIKGFRVINESIFGTDFDDLNVPILGKKRPFSFTINGDTLTAFFVEIAGAIRLYVIRDNYTTPVTHLGIGTYIELIQNGTTNYDIQQFDWAVSQNTLFITHYSGTMIPFVIEFNSAATEYVAYIYTDSTTPAMAYNDNYGTGGVTPVFPSYSVASPFFYPMEDLGNRNSSVGLSFNMTTKKLDVTSTDSDSVEALQRTPIFYFESMGSNNFGDGNTVNVIASGFYYRESNITNGARFSPAVLWEAAAVDISYMLDVTSASIWGTSSWYEGNWPKTVTSHEGRIVFGGTKSDPLTFWGSKIGNNKYLCHIKSPAFGSVYLSYPAPSGATTMSDPFVFTVATKEDSEIRFLQSAGSLVIGTDRKEYIATGGDTALSALSVQLKPFSSVGSRPVRTANNGDAVYYISSDGKRLCKFKYNDSNGSFRSQDLSVLFRDLIDNDAIAKVEWVPHINTLLILMESSNLYGLVENTQAEMTAFYKTGLEDIYDLAFCYDVTFAGANRRGPHVALIHGDYGLCSYEQLYFERSRLLSDVTYAQAVHNASMYRNNTVVLSRWDATTWRWGTEDITGLPANSIPIPLEIFPEGSTCTVTFGTFDPYEEEVTIPETAEGGIAGYHVYTSSTDLEFVNVATIGGDPAVMEGATMPVEAGQQWGTSQMGIKNIDKIGIRVYKSYSVEISSGEGDPQVWEEVVFADDEGNAASTRKELNFSSSPKYDQIIYFRNTKAEPCTIIGLNMRGVSNDG